MLCDSPITCMSKRICCLENRKYGFEIEHMRILSVFKSHFWQNAFAFVAYDIANSEETFCTLS